MAVEYVALPGMPEGGPVPAAEVPDVWVTGEITCRIPFRANLSELIRKNRLEFDRLAQTKNAGVSGRAVNWEQGMEFLFEHLANVALDCSLWTKAGELEEGFWSADVDDDRIFLGRPPKPREPGYVEAAQRNPGDRSWTHLHHWALMRSLGREDELPEMSAVEELARLKNLPRGYWGHF